MTGPRRWPGSAGFDLVLGWVSNEAAVVETAAWVNNAGISTLAPVLDTDPGDLARMIEVNLLGTFHGLQAAGW